MTGLLVALAIMVATVPLSFLFAVFRPLKRSVLTEWKPAEVKRCIMNQIISMQHQFRNLLAKHGIMSHSDEVNISEPYDGWMHNGSLRIFNSAWLSHNICDAITPHQFHRRFESTSVIGNIGLLMERNTKGGWHRQANDKYIIFWLVICFASTEWQIPIGDKKIDVFTKLFDSEWDCQSLDFFGIFIPNHSAYQLYTRFLIELSSGIERSWWESRVDKPNRFVFQWMRHRLSGCVSLWQTTYLRAKVVKWLAKHNTGPFIC